MIKTAGSGGIRMSKEGAFFEKHVINPEENPIIYHYTTLYGVGDRGFLPHWHPNMELLYIVEGAADIYVNMEKSHLESGELLIVNSNCIHTFVSTAERTIYHCIIIDNNFCSYYNLNYVNDRFVSRVVNEQVKEIFLMMVQELSLSFKDSWAEENLKSLALVLIRNLYRYNLIVGEESAIRKEIKTAGIIKHALEYIDSHYESDLSLKEISRQINVSPYYLCRLFKSVVNQTMNSYIMERRCSQARLLLEKSDLPIREIAFQCGFMDPSYFSKCYQRIYGKLPLEERE